VKNDYKKHVFFWFWGFFGFFVLIIGYFLKYLQFDDLNNISPVYKHLLFSNLVNSFKISLGISPDWLLYGKGKVLMDK